MSEHANTLNSIDLQDFMPLESLKKLSINLFCVLVFLFKVQFPQTRKCNEAIGID